MTSSAIQTHIRALNACNQRGGRMLSLIDLLDAGTIDLPLAAYLAALMRTGTSLLVGARPGGAGKTAVMCALLNFLPDQTDIHALVNSSVLKTAQHNTKFGDACYLAHEIGQGMYTAYIWGQDVRSFFALAAQGHIIASNLHADTHQETVAQLCDENGVPPAHLDAVTLQIYLHVEQSSGWALRRQVNCVYECSDGQRRLLWKRESKDRYTRLTESKIVSREQEQKYADWLNDLYRRGICRIEDVRYELTQFKNTPGQQRT